MTNAQWSFAYEYVRTNDKYKALNAGYPSMREKKAHARRMFAGKIMSSPRMVRLIEELRADIRAVQKLTFEQHLEKLEEIRDMAMNRGSLREALKAEELRGKAAGFYVERSINLDVTMTIDQMRERARSILESNPQVRRALGFESPQALLEAPFGQDREVIDIAEHAPSGVETID